MATISQINTTAGTADAVQYSVVLNKAATAMKGKAIYNARTTTPTKSLQAVAETMVREGSKYQAFEITGIITQFANVVARLVNEGNAVNVGSLMRIRPSIRGTFENEEEGYTEGKQKIVVATSTGALLRDVAIKAPVRRIDGKTLPELEAVYNAKTGNEDTISSNGMILVTGKYLDFDHDAEDEGYFVVQDGTEHKLTVISADKTMANLMCEATLTAGEDVQLFFRTSKDGSLEQYTYDPGLTAE